MKNRVLIQLWVAGKIWIIAAAVNTLTGAFYLAGFHINDELNMFLLVGSVFSLIFSFPAFIVLFIVINRCARHHADPRSALKYVFCTGILLTVIGFWLFSYTLGINEILYPLFFTALLSCLIAIGCQYRSVKGVILRDEASIENFLKS